MIPATPPPPPVTFVIEQPLEAAAVKPGIRPDSAPGAATAIVVSGRLVLRCTYRLVDGRWHHGCVVQVVTDS